MRSWSCVIALGLVAALMPCQAKESLSLGGPQAQKEVRVDLDRTDLSVKDEYVIPQGCTLLITGGGSVQEDDRKQRTRLTVAGGRLCLGDPAAKARSLASLPLIDMSKLNIHVKGGEVTVRNCALRLDHMSILEGRFSSDHAALEFQHGESSIISSKAGVTMDSCSLQGGLSEARLHGSTDREDPADLKKHVQLRNCVFLAAPEKVGVAYLWCMSRCDILGDDVLSRKKPAGQGAPHPIRLVYFSDRKYRELLEKTLKDDYALSIANVPAPFNAGLGVTAEALKDEKK